MTTHRPLRIAGAVLMTVGLAMAAMPFVGALSGVAFDRYGAWDISLNRVVLHVLPGLVGAGLGVLFMRGAYLRPAFVAAIVVSVWMGIGPWALNAVLPAGHESGKMFVGIPGFDAMSRAQQMFLESMCHWVPGLIALAAAYIAGLVVLAPRTAARRAV